MIICAAIRDARTGAVFGGIRHGFIYENIRYFGISIPKEFMIEGFLDNNDKFYDRFEAFEYAKQCGQISTSTLQLKIQEREAELYSEDLY